MICEWVSVSSENCMWATSAVGIEAKEGGTGGGKGAKGAETAAREWVRVEVGTVAGAEIGAELGVEVKGSFEGRGGAEEKGREVGLGSVGMRVEEGAMGGEGGDERGSCASAAGV